jgi:hypothetical protein
MMRSSLETPRRPAGFQDGRGGRGKGSTALEPPPEGAAREKRGACAEGIPPGRVDGGGQGGKSGEASSW